MERLEPREVRLELAQLRVRGLAERVAVAPEDRQIRRRRLGPRRLQERLDAAVLGGTHIPGGRQGLRKLWPFPVALSFHWLQPAALGRAVDGAQGLTASDLKRFNVKAEDVGKPAFAIPDRLKNLGAGLRSSNAAPVE